MADEAADVPNDTSNAAGQKQPSERRAREQSTIQFPYNDLDDAIEVANGIMKCGGVPCEPDQLAGAMGQQPSGSFRLKIAAARIFGLIETVQNKYQLTNLGFAIVDPTRQRTAKADAFLHVPLYRRVYEEFRNKTLPPRPAPLEHAFVDFGVAVKQKDKARLCFERSAQQAGYFDQGGRDRLIRPVGAGALPSPDERGDETIRGGGGNGGGGSSNSGDGTGDGAQSIHGGVGAHGVARRQTSSHTHPFIQGLLDHLPQPETTWTIEGRAKWLRTAADIFDLMYKGSGEIAIKVERTDGGQQ